MQQHGSYMRHRSATIPCWGVSECHLINEMLHDRLMHQPHTIAAISTPLQPYSLQDGSSETAADLLAETEALLADLSKSEPTPPPTGYLSDDDSESFALLEESVSPQPQRFWQQEAFTHRTCDRRHAWCYSGLKCYRPFMYSGGVCCRPPGRLPL